MTPGKFLAIFFMCHQRPDRSFFFRGRQFPICARCTGMLIGFIAGIICAIVTGCNHYQWFLLSLIPMLTDGIIQQYTRYESTNIRRAVTGFFGGIGIIYVFLNIHFFTVWLVKLTLKYI